MAKTAEKNAKKAKAAAAKAYLPFLVGVNAWYVVVRFLYLGAERFHYMALLGCGAIYAATYPTALEAASQPNSMASYFFDVMALTLFAQFIGALSDKAWYLLLLVPGFASYKLVAWKFGGPAAPKQPAEPTEEEAAAAGKKEKKPKVKRMKGR